MRPRVQVVGHIVWDHRFWAENLDRRGGRTGVTRYAQSLGGPGAVAAVTIESLGGHAILVSRVGRDSNGEAALQRLRDAGVDVDLVDQQAGSVTAVSAVAIAPDGERHIYPFPGEFQPTRTANLPTRLADNLSALLVDSRWPTMALANAQEARAASVPVVVDLDVDNQDMWHVVRHSTYTICDEDLAEAFGGSNALVAHIEALGSWGAVTLGSRGSITRSTTVPAFQIKAVDTTGAGDVFHGAFALAIAEGQRPENALVFASASAAVKCATGKIPSRLEVDRLLDEEPRG